jgi:hypothetical protein
LLSFTPDQPTMLASIMSLARLPPSTVATRWPFCHSLTVCFFRSALISASASTRSVNLASLGLPSGRRGVCVNVSSGWMRVR